jgi:hypothetical protein
MTRDTLSQGGRIIDDAAAAAGRDPASVRRVLNVGGAIEPSRGEGLVGPASYWEEELTRLALEVGFDAFVFWPAHDEEEQIEAFAAEVIPSVREAVAAEAKEHPNPA